MDRSVNTKVLMAGAWAALLYPGLLILGWVWSAGFIPLLAPTTNAADLVARYQAHDFGIRFGMVLVMFGAAMFLPLGATTAYFISRIEGFFGPLSILQVMGATCGAVLTFYPAMWWEISIYRADRAPDLVLMLSDASWMQWVGGLTIYYPTIISLAIAAFLDKSPEPVFPRWFGYANVWLVLLLLPGQMIFFFKTGPFAWDGLLSFWVAFAAFGIWFPVAFYVLRKAVLRLDAAREGAIASAVRPGLGLNPL